MTTTQESLTTDIFSDLIDTTEPYKVDETFKFKNYLAVQPSSQANLQVPGPILFNSFYQDGYFLPSESYISIKGRLVKNDGTAYDNEEVTLVNNAMMFLFKDARYAISDTEIETVQYLGQATSLFGLLTLPDDFSTSSGLSRCWSKDTTNNAHSSKYQRSVAKAADAAILAGEFTPIEHANYNQGFAVRKSFIFSSVPKGSFTFTIPFSHIFGFSEYNKLLYGVQQTLTLERNGDDNLALHRADDNALTGKVELSNITWYIPKYELNTAASVEMTQRAIAKIQLPLIFRARTCKRIEIPAGSTSFEWPLTMKTGLEKPRWVIVAFQTGRRSQTETPAVFDNIGLTNAYVTLNGDKYPREEILTDFARNDYARLYKSFDDFKKDFYGYDELVGGSQVSFPAFKTLFPIIVFDLTKQSEVIKTGAIDMRVTLNFADVAANTAAYALIISDRLFKVVSDGKSISQLIS